MNFRIGTLAGVAALGLTWALLWAFPGGIIEAIDNVAPGAHGFTRRIDMWPQTLGLPGLMAGVLYSLLLLVTEGRRRVVELAVPRSAAWGGLSGALVGALVVWGLDSGLSGPAPLAGAVVGLGMALGALSGVVTPLLFRFVARRRAAAARS